MLISKQEAEKLVTEVLQKKPDSSIAERVKAILSKENQNKKDDNKNSTYIEKIKKKNLKELVLFGEYLKTKEFIQEVDKDTLEQILFDIGCNEEDISAYTFVCFLINNFESAEYHLLASKLLNKAFFYLNGAYQSSLYHMKRAIELDSNNIELKEDLLFFYKLPLTEKPMSDEEAKNLVDEILQKKPHSLAVRKTKKFLNMTNKEKIIRWIVNGNKMGKDLFLEEKEFWIHVGIQKWEDKYKVYTSKNLSRKEIKIFEKLSDALEFIDKCTKINLIDLKPCKNEKINLDNQSS